MTTKPTKKTATLTASAFLAASIAAVSGHAGATELSLDQLDAKSLDGGYMLFAKALTNEGKCGDAGKGDEGKCGEGKCGDAGKGDEGKCGEGKCGDAGKGDEGKCGEGKCGES
mgnify:CR=1 FL=1